MSSSEEESWVANICMMVIGIGYLFPISAIWAAFDYWKLLFPSENIEFTVTLLYQAVSLLTVAVLSFSTSFRLGPRILGGFGGQFLCLLAFLFFRWIIDLMAQGALYGLVLLLVALCAVATGCLDSSLLALCSQYSPRMQGWLQLGIGFGTLVSVLYRDGTKFFFNSDMADSVTAYFSIALVTVLVCIGCYKLLMRLPISRQVCLREGAGQPFLSPPPSPGRQESFKCYTPTISASPMPGMPVSDRSKVVDVEDEKQECGLELAELDTSLTGVLKIVWRNQLAVFSNFTLTTLCYPGMLTSIPCRDFLALRSGAWFETLLLTVFTLCDITTRFFTHRRCGLRWNNIWITVLMRLALFPAVLYCILSPDSTDVVSIVVVGLFGALNGYVCSLSLIVVNEIPMLVTDDQRKSCGRISACSVNGGLAAGSLLAALFASSLGISSSSAS